MTQWDSLEHDIMHCRLCPRLVSWREQVAQQRRRAYRDQAYWGRPAPGFGDRRARVLVVGLAPGAHGANRTGRLFTGDSSGDFLFAALHRAGFANQPRSEARGDGLTLHELFITAACRCAPPDNRPARDELTHCAGYLARELALLPQLTVIVALGRIAFDAILGHYRGATTQVLAKRCFGHGTVTSLGDGLPWLIASYHPSRQNTQTGRLSSAMFDQVWQSARELLARQAAT